MRSPGLLGVFLGALAAIIVVRFVDGPEDAALAVAVFALGAYLGYAGERRATRGKRRDSGRDRER